jgi:hypothetical protein
MCGIPDGSTMDGPCVRTKAAGGYQIMGGGYPYVGSTVVLDGVLNLQMSKYCDSSFFLDARCCRW